VATLANRKREPRPWWKTCLIWSGVGCGGALVLLLIIAGVIYSKLTSRPPAALISPPGAASGGEAAVAPSQTQSAPPPVEEQVQQIEQAQQSRQPAAIELRLNESQLNQLIAEKGGSGDVADLRASIRSADAVISGTARWNNRNVYVTATVVPEMSGGQPRLRITSAMVGSLGLPDSLVQRYQAELDSGFANELRKNRDVQITDVGIQGGELVIKGTTVPR